MIHIGIDGNEANVLNRVGSNRYAYGIIKAIHDLRFTNKELRFTVYLKAKPLDDMPKEDANWKYKVIGPGLAWTQWRLPLELYLPWNRPDVFFSPGHYAPRIAPMPTVVSIMDLAFLKMPNLFMKFKRGVKQLSEWTEYSVRQASHIIAISEHTKQDIVSLYGVQPDKITVAYPGADKPLGTKDRGRGTKLPDKYILHVGTLQPRKNIVRLIQAFEQLPPKFKAYNLVLAGQSGWLTDEIEKALADSPARDRIVRTGYVDQDEVPRMMAQSACLVLVGLYEGFGMPPAEALAAGTVPVVSNNTSLPEVVGEAGILVDPYSVSSIKRGIMRAVELTPEERAKRVAIGQDHIRTFSWDESAKKIMDVLINIKAKV